MAQPDDRIKKIRRNNWIVLAVLTIFVIAVFLLSFSHIGREARPERDETVTSPAVDG
ncbi:hypothetical protein [Agrobacterium pusense]|uniref:hypothetical protein n=1 Tax=Agrobacterium pusense TaxID=648995 RepID=UPI0013B00686